MKIVEKDFRIEYDGECFILYLLKTKKELKEDSGDMYKVKGYYSKQIYHALNAAYNWRLSKKYPFKEPTLKFKQYLLQFKKALNTLELYSNEIYNPIITFKKKVFDEYKRL